MLSLVGKEKIATFLLTLVLKYNIFIENFRPHDKKFYTPLV